MNIKTPRWATPLLKPSRYKAAKGGRGSGKSHFFAEAAVEAMMLDPNCSVVCIREIQKSLKFSAKRLVEGKIEAYKLNHYFDITQNEIRRKGGRGVMIFQGMQDHTAESIKSLEGFNIAWVEEAQSLSERSLKLLRPTIRAENSEIWFSWNPDQKTDPVDVFFCGPKGAPSDAVVVHVNSEDNPFLPETLRLERESDRLRMAPEDYHHVWEGGYNEKSDAVIFKGKHTIDYFEPQEKWIPLLGLDWGFSNDPTAAIEAYVQDNVLYIRREAGRIGLELDDTPAYLTQRIPNIKNHVTRADSARPESISYIVRHGLPYVEPVKKWKGSVEDGVAFIKSFSQIIIHPECAETIKEFRLYKYKVDNRTGDVLPEIEDKNNHYIDALRYALGGLIIPKHPTGSTFAGKAGIKKNY
jgi:phage terminase large subunit